MFDPASRFGVSISVATVIEPRNSGTLSYVVDSRTRIPWMDGRARVLPSCRFLFLEFLFSWITVLGSVSNTLIAREGTLS